MLDDSSLSFPENETKVLTSIKYPVTNKVDVVDDYHGELIYDPFRWLEDSNRDETKEWTEAQNQLTEAVLSRVPGRSEIRERISKLWDYPKFGVPFERGGRWFHTYNSGLQDQSALYVGDSALDRGRKLIDPNDLSVGGTVAITNVSVSHDGSLVAFSISESGSDWLTWKVVDVASGNILPDEVRWSKFSSASWRKDLSGFYYSAVEEPSTNGIYLQESRGIQVKFHRLGSFQDSDEVIFYEPEQPDWLPSARVSEDDKYLFISIRRGTAPKTTLLYVDLEDQHAGYREISSDFKCKIGVISNDGPVLYVLTDLGAEKQKIASINLLHPDEPWQEIVPENQDTLLEAQLCGGKFICHYLTDAHSSLRVYHGNGELSREIPIPVPSSLSADILGHGSFEGQSASKSIYFKVVSFIESGALYSYDISSDTLSLMQSSRCEIAPSDFITERIFAISADGTSVPIFLTHRRDIEPNGDRQVLLYGYGGFDIAITPSFSVTFAAWLDQGGILAVANLRGGGEYGKIWYDAGRLANKQNVFDDFSACAKWLCESGWSKPSRIGISGASNGGLLVGACLTQRPNLFGAAIADVGVLDMLRFDRFTIGWAWRSDYGNPNHPDQYRWIRAYSPLHNIKNGTCYPPTLILTGDHDDRVIPGHSFKFVAALQEAQGCDAPILLRVAKSVGHGAGKPTSKLIDEASDRLAFLQLALGGDNWPGDAR